MKISTKKIYALFFIVSIFFQCCNDESEVSHPLKGDEIADMLFDGAEKHEGEIPASHGNDLRILEYYPTSFAITGKTLVISPRTSSFASGFNIQLKGSSSYYTIPVKNSSLGRVLNSTTEGTNHSVFEIPIPSNFSGDQFCFNYNVYDEAGNVSETVETCVAIAGGEAPSLFSNTTWNIVKEELIIDGIKQFFGSWEPNVSLIKYSDINTYVECGTGEVKPAIEYFAIFQKLQYQFTEDLTTNFIVNGYQHKISLVSDGPCSMEIYEPYDVTEANFIAAETGRNWIYDEESEKLIITIGYQSGFVKYIVYDVVSNEDGTLVLAGETITKTNNGDGTYRTTKVEYHMELQKEL